MSAPDADAPFQDLGTLLRGHARQRPQATALIDGVERLCYLELDTLADRVAATLQQHGLGPGHTLAICATASARYVAAFLGALRAGLAVAPLSPAATPRQLTDMLADCEARVLLTDTPAAQAWLGSDDAPTAAVPRVSLDDGATAGASWSQWLAGADVTPAAVAIDPQWPFNIIYSSGTTGVPKGIVQPHAMRWAHIRRAAAAGYGPDAVTLLATPLYSNTTLVALIPSLAWGGAVALMARFEARAYLRLAQAVGATHTMLVPVQYQRLLACPDFDTTDLSTFRMKLCTSAPFRAELKAQVLRRWPGALVEYYGLTEGGGTCILQAHLHPDKLHTVGRPAEGHDIRLIDDDGAEVAAGGIGEIVGRSPGMMTGYHRQSALTAAAEWHDAQGRRFLRTGDIGRFDADGFLVLLDRRKDMIISGGFNVYPSDLERELAREPEVAEAAVFGVPCQQWGETPVACVVPHPGRTIDAEGLRRRVNARLGRTQRLAALAVVVQLPRSAIGKVLKRELRARWMQASAQTHVDEVTDRVRADRD